MLVAVCDAFELHLLELIMVADPRDDLVFKRFSSQYGTYVDNTAISELKPCLNESLPKLLVAFFDFLDVFRVL